MKSLGVIKMYNGLDIHQSKHYIKVSCSTYIKKILKGHNWDTPNKSSPITTPLPHDKKFITALENDKGPEDIVTQRKLATNMNFKYRQAIGELLFAAVTCRPDILFAVIKLSQYSTRPAKIHFQAVKHVFKYLRDSANDGLHFWRSTTRDELPDTPLPTVPNDTHSCVTPQHDPYTAYGMVDADWGGDTSHRRSVTGLALFMAGAPIVYKSRFQTTVSLSSTESEFIAASDAGKLTLYVRGILDSLDLPQTSATHLYEDNEAAIAMANSSKPTRRTRHVELRHFALLDWTETDQIALSSIATANNAADALTKALGPQSFTRHRCTLLGKRKPAYCTF